jgi:hypothetical protein
MWWHRRPPLRGSAWMHVMLLVLTHILYAGVPSLQGTDRGPLAHLGRGCELEVGPIGAEDLGASTINAKKRRWWAPGRCRR